MIFADCGKWYFKNVLGNVMIDLCLCTGCSHYNAYKRARGDFIWKNKNNIRKKFCLFKTVNENIEFKNLSSTLEHGNGKILFHILFSFFHKKSPRAQFVRVIRPHLVCSLLYRSIRFFQILALHWVITQSLIVDYSLKLLNYVNWMELYNTKGIQIKVWLVVL